MTEWSHHIDLATSHASLHICPPPPSPLGPGSTQAAGRPTRTQDRHESRRKDRRSRQGPPMIRDRRRRPRCTDEDHEAPTRITVHQRGQNKDREPTGGPPTRTAKEETPQVCRQLPHMPPPFPFTYLLSFLFFSLTNYRILMLPPPNATQTRISHIFY